MAIRYVGVAGCGAMGAGIAEIVLRSGYTVMVREINDELLQKGLKRIHDALDRMDGAGDAGGVPKEEMLKRLSSTVVLEDLGQCDLVIEAAFEDLSVKSGLFSVLDGVCKETTVFASNTSSLPLTEIAAATSRMTRFVGLHFFNPPSVMPLVEVVRTMRTNEEIVLECVDFIKSLKKVPIVAKDSAGFIVNRLLTPYLLDAMRAAGDGVASIEDIDIGMKLGCNYPMGPLMLADFIGLDVLYNAANIFFEEYREKRYAPPPILKQLVKMGHIGSKAGAGFYDWSDRKRPKPAKLAL